VTIDILSAEYAGGGPGFVTLRVAGRAHAPTPSRLAPPTLLIADGPGWRRLATVPGTPLVDAGPAGPAFAVDLEIPLHLAAVEGRWWLEPGPVVTAQADAVALEELRARVREIGAELAALRERVAAGGRVEAAAEAEPAIAPPTAATAVPVPRPRLRGLRPTVPALLVAVGTLAVGDAVATVTWQEPVSALWAGRQQHVLEGEVAQLDRTFAAQAPAAAKAVADPAARMRALARTLERTASAGHPLGRLRIPRLDTGFVVVQGTGAGSLRRGPGHYLGTALPGQLGTVGIAGHRTTYGAPFRHLDALRRGDAIDVTMPYGRFVYRVEGTRIVKPQDVSSLQAIGRQRLVLTACHPLYSAAQRLVVLARLESATPRGAATAPAAGDAAPGASAPRA
jgi:sortase A